MTKKAEPLNPFDPDPSTPAPAPAVNAQELVTRLAKLQQNAQLADRERAAAEARLEAAQKDLATIDEQLRKLGVEPETAEDALKQLEQELATLTAQYEQQVEAERRSYQDILAAAQ